MGLRLGESALGVQDDAEIVVILGVGVRLVERLAIGLFGLGEEPAGLEGATGGKGLVRRGGRGRHRAGGRAVRRAPRLAGG